MEHRISKVGFSLMSCLLLIFATSFFAAYAAEPKAIQWQEASPSVFEQAKKEHRLVLIFGKAEWCPWCKMMKNTTYQNPVLIQLVEAHYIPVHIDVDRDSGPAQHFHIVDLPTMIIMDSNQRVIKKLTGYTSAQTMSRILNDAAESHLKL